MASKPASRRRVYLALLLISLALSLAAVLLPMISTPLAPVPQEGQVATRDYRASSPISYTSEVLTQQRRDLAERQVESIYTLPDTRVARRQMEQLRAALAYINSVRSDAYATTDQKLADLAALEEISLSAQAVETILRLPDSRWQELQQESLAVLERVMRSAIRPESLDDTISRVPAAVSLSMPEDQAEAVAELASAFVAPNSQYSESLTQAARQAALQEVDPVLKSYAEGQTIALQGEIFSAEDIEALQHLGVSQPDRDWIALASAALLTLLMVFLTAFYLRRKQVIFAGELRGAGLVAALFLVFLVVARLILPLYPQIAYAFPLAAFAMTTAALFGIELAVITSLPLAVLAPYGLPDGLALTIYYLITSLFGVLALGRARRTSAFLLAGMMVSVSGLVVVLVFRLQWPAANLGERLLVPLFSAVLCGLVSASLTILLHLMLARVMGVAAPMQLVDLTRPDHPLLRLLLRDAPGTYQHSLQVANLAEQAAEHIGADPLLVRVGALYHDIGKAANAAFFIENQPPGFINPHDNLDPVESAAIIIRHVSDGLELGRKHRLPRRILDFIAEHHGTGLARYQYVNAVNAAGGDASRIDQSLFRYLGPMPRSRETALLMLADGAEARVRAELPEDEETLRNLVRTVVSDRISSGQLNETRLTLRDLNLIIDSFTATLRGVYHPRVKYPRLESGPDVDPLLVGEGSVVTASDASAQ